MRHGHGELQAMLDEVDRGLDEIDVLAKAATPDDRDAPAARSLPSPAPAPWESTQRQDDKLAAGKSGEPHWQLDWVERQEPASELPAAKIPLLPEIESPARRVLKPFPERHAPSQPQVSGYLRQPPSTEIIGMPETGILWLPESGEFFKRPQSGEFFRRPGEQAATGQ